MVGCKLVYRPCNISSSLPSCFSSLSALNKWVASHFLLASFFNLCYLPLYRMFWHRVRNMERRMVNLVGKKK